MNCGTGEIVRFEDLDIATRQVLENLAQKATARSVRDLAEVSSKLSSALEETKPFAPVDVPMLKHQSKVRRRNWMRNRPCPCGSGKKFKKCCWDMFTD